MKSNQLLFWSVTVALGGFLFGFDTAVISGAEQAIQKVWQLSDFEHGLAVAIALYGTVLGALCGGIPADRIGRKATLAWVAALYLISAIGSAFAPDELTFMIFRFLGGLGVGASSVVAPMYIAEISPPERRGKLVALFQFNIVFGILIAYLSNYLLQGIGESSWRWMLGVEAVPSVAFLLMVLKVPESPRWLLVKRGDKEAARATLMKINTEEETDRIIDNIIRHKSAAESKPGLLSFFGKKHSFPIVLAILFAFFNQMSGINAIIYYAPRIFSLAGYEGNSALLTTAGIGLFNLIFTLIGMQLIDKAGRKKLMIIGSIGLTIALLAVSYSFHQSEFGGVPVFLFAYIAFFAMSQGAVIWVFISEIFPNHMRAFGQSMGSFTHWIMAAVIANIFPYFVNTFATEYIFLFFAFMMALQLVYVLLLMPETKGTSLEDLEDKLVNE